MRTEARQAFRSGMERIQAGETEEGIALLLEAYEILPHPNVLYNVARAYAEAERNEEALDYFEQYLATRPADRDEVMKVMASLRQKIAESAGGAEAAENSAAVDTETDAERAAKEEDIQALEDSALQIATLAESTQSEQLRQRAEQLREVAARLRDPDGASAGAMSTEADGEAGSAQGDGAPLAAEQNAIESLDDAVAYEEEVVSASRFAQSPLDAPNAIHIITAQDIRLTGHTMIGELIRRVPGADVMTAGGPGDVNTSMRGFNQPLSNKMLVLYDGRSVYVDTLGTVFWLNQPYNVEDIERIEVIRGPASALYGADAFSGIINIITKPPGTPETLVSAGIGTDGALRFASRASGTVGALGYRLSVGFSREDHFVYRVGEDRVDIRLGDRQPNPIEAYDHRQAEGAINYQIADGVDFNLAAGIRDNIQSTLATSPFELFTSAGPVAHISTSIGFHGLKLRSYWNHFDAYSNSVVVSGDRDQAKSRYQQELVDVELEWLKSFDFLFPQAFQVSVGYRLKDVTWPLLDAPHTEHHYSASLQDTIQLLPSLSLVASLRTDLHPLLDGPVISPRGALVYRLTEGSSLRGSVGTAFRTPTFLESYFDVVADTPVRGVGLDILGSEVANRPLRPESIASYEVGYRNAESEYFDVDTTAYYNRVKDIIYPGAIEPASLQDADADAYDEGLARFQLGQLTFVNRAAEYDVVGGELSVRAYPVRGLDLYANYAINRSFVSNPDLAAAEDEDKRTSEHKVNAGVQYRAPFGLDVAVDLHWVSPQVWVEQGFDNAGNVAPIVAELPAYHLVNARVGYRFFDDTVDVGVRAFNLTDHRHRQHPRGEVLHARYLATATYRFQ